MESIYDLPKGDYGIVGTDYKIKDIFSITFEKLGIKVIYTLTYRTEEIKGRYYESLWIVRGIVHNLNSPDCITYDKESLIKRRRED